MEGGDKGAGGEAKSSDSEELSAYRQLPGNCLGFQQQVQNFMVSILALA